MLAAKLSFLGEEILTQAEGLGRFTRFCWAILKWFFLDSRWSNRLHLITPQLYAIGTRSIPVVIIVGAFVGMVLAVEAYDQFASIGQETRLGGIINISVVRQIGPVLSAVMIAGRVGGAVSAELGTMRVTEQLDALRVMGADPINYLVIPRIFACLIMVPILTIFSDVFGVFGGYLVTVCGFGVNASDYWEFSARFVEGYDVISGLVKSLLFGLAIGAISCYKGFHCRSGAAGVGRAATDSFVTSFIVIVILNLFLANFLKDLYFILFGYETVNAFS